MTNRPIATTATPATWIPAIQTPATAYMTNRPIATTVTPATWIPAIQTPATAYMTNRRIATTATPATWIPAIQYTGDCVHDQPTDCDDGNACNVDSCDTDTGDCVHDQPTDCDDGDSCTDDSCNSETGDCVHRDNGTCGEELCRTPGFWKERAAWEKVTGKKVMPTQNITQQVIDAADGGQLNVCGTYIDNTDVGNSHSALEAMCISVKGEPKRQLVRQLTAAALNCVMSGSSDCSGLSVGDNFATCDALCAGTGTDYGQCISAIDCFNNGGDWVGDVFGGGYCAPAMTYCDDDDLASCDTAEDCDGVDCLSTSCHERELCQEDGDPCFEGGPAGSQAQCKEAEGNNIYVP